MNESYQIKEEYIYGKIVLITGATSGIGKALAVLMAEKGAKVIAHGRNIDSLNSLKNDANSKMFNTVIADLRDEFSLNKLEENIQLFKPDILILNAGYLIEKKLTSDINNNDINDMLAVNLVAPIRLARTYARINDTKMGKRLVLVLSTSCFYQRKGMGLYIAAKMGLMGFGKVMQLEIDRLGIRTILVYPGRTNTAIRKDDHPEYMKPESVAESLVALLNLPEDIAPNEFIFRPTSDIRI